MRPGVGNQVLPLALLLFGAAVLGMLVVRQPALAAVLVVGLFAIWGTLERAVRPVFIGLLMLAYMNLIPFVDLTILRLPAGIRVDDVVMGTLALLGIAWTWGAERRSPIAVLRLVLLLTFAYWVIVLVKTVVTGDGTLVLSAFYGRDLLAMSMALAIAAIAREERDAELLVGVLVAGACLYSVGHFGSFLFGVDMSFITHPYKVGETIDQARIFSKGQALIVPALVLALGRAVVSATGRRRVLYWSATIILIIEILTEFTRANYLGLLVSLIVGGVLLAGVRTERAQSRTVTALASLGIAVSAAWLASETAPVRAWLAGTSVAARFSTVTSEVAAQGGTFGYRLVLYRTMLGELGGSWLLGLGFWHPAEHYASALPQGSIRNNDTGLLAILMTMGVVGVLLFVWPLVLATRWGLGVIRAGAEWVRATGWSAVVYSVWVLVTSFSLGFLSYGAGLAATAIIVGAIAGARQADTQSTPATDVAA